MESKHKFISQVVTGKSPARSCEDVDDTTLSYAEVKALATGDERIKEKMTLDIEVAKLHAAHIQLDTLHQQMETAKEELQKPFPQEAELTEKEKRLNALNALLTVESHNLRKDMERSDNEAEPALRPTEKEVKHCVHALLSELAQKSADAPRPERVTAVQEPVR